MLRSLKNWGIYSDDGNVQHIIPENDLKLHSQDLSFPIEPSEWFKENIQKSILIIDKGIEFNSDCKCNPELRYLLESNSWQIIHNSFDGREGIEWAEEILRS